MYQCKLDKVVAKFLEKRDLKFLRTFQQKIVLLSENPYRKDIDVQVYKGNGDGHFRLRIGKYRFLYYIINNELVIYFYDADSRGAIYK